MARPLRSAEWASAIIESAQHMMIATDPSGLVTSFNRASQSKLGYPASEVVGKETPALWHDLDEVVARAGELSDELDRAIEPGFDVFIAKPQLFGSETRPWTFIRCDGTRFPVQLTVTCVRSELGDALGYLGVIEDLTERERLIEELRQSNDELEEFAYRASHDLRSPLLSSLGLIEETRQSLQEGDSEVALEGLNHAENALRKLETLVSDILQLSKSRHQREDARWLDIPDAVASALQSVSHLPGADRLDFRVEVAGKQTVLLPPSRLRLILENLFSNAIKYRDPSAQDPWVRIATQTQDGRFTLSVSDNGLGVPEERQSSLFKMFKRLHSRVAFGSGLGLYMIKKTVAAMGGTVAFEDLGDGSLFEVHIPTQSDATDRVPSAAGPSEDAP